MARSGTPLSRLRDRERRRVPAVRIEALRQRGLEIAASEALAAADLAAAAAEAASDEAEGAQLEIKEALSGARNFTALQVGGVNVRPFLDRTDGTALDDPAAVPMMVVAAQSRAAVSATGPYLGYNSGTGVFSLAAGVANGVATLDGSGLIPEGQLPALAITDTFEVASQAAMLALTAQRGDVAVRSDINKSFILKATPASTLANWVELRTPTDAVLSVNGFVGAVTLTTTHIAEGANLYFTDVRAQAAISAGAGISYSGGSVSLNLASANGWTAQQSFGAGARVGSGVAGEWYSFSRKGADGFLEINAEQAAFRGFRILYQNVVQFELDATGLVKTLKLASASPGSGSIWYDAADSNRVKYTP